MARIVVTYYKMQELSIGKRMYYYEAFIEELRKNGNDVLAVNTAFFNPYWSNSTTNKNLEHMILTKTKAFDPELIITFNHRIPQCMLDCFDVPIIIWDGDSPKFICDKEYIKKHIDRYHIFSISKDWYDEYLEWGFKSEQYAFMANATSVITKDVPQDKNITYLGTRIWTENTVPKCMSQHVYLPQAKEIVRENLTTGMKDSRIYLDKFFGQQKDISKWSEEKVYPLLETRWLTLANVLDLGLTICGSYSRWEAVYEMMPQILAMYDPQRVWTLEENIDFYNSSKISLSPIHPQANGKAFPWRAFDVMASNACLVIENSSDLKELIGNEVDIPMYNSPYEVRDICKDLLKNETRRREIVEQSNKWIEKNARWIDRLKDAEQIVGINICNNNQNGKVEDIIDEAGVITDFEEEKKFVVSIDKKNVARLTPQAQVKPAASPATTAGKKTPKRVYKCIPLGKLFSGMKYIAFLGIAVCILKLMEMSGIIRFMNDSVFVPLIIACLVALALIIGCLGIEFWKRLRLRKQS